MVTHFCNAKRVTHKNVIKDFDLTYPHHIRIYSFVRVTNALLPHEIRTKYDNCVTFLWCNKTKRNAKWRFHSVTRNMLKRIQYWCDANPCCNIIIGIIGTMVPPRSSITSTMTSTKRWNLSKCHDGDYLCLTSIHCSGCWIGVRDFDEWKRLILDYSIGAQAVQTIWALNRLSFLPVASSIHSW